MKLRSDSGSRRRKGKWRTELDDRCGTVMDESLVISSGSDYDPLEESDAESKGNVSLEEEDMKDFEKGRRTESGKRKRVDLIEGRRRRERQPRMG